MAKIGDLTLLISKDLILIRVSKHAFLKNMGPQIGKTLIAQSFEGLEGFICLT
jgi:hypothetical protein